MLGLSRSASSERVAEGAMRSDETVSAAAAPVSRPIKKARFASGLTQDQMEEDGNGGPVSPSSSSLTASESDGEASVSGSNSGYTSSSESEDGDGRGQRSFDSEPRTPKGKPLSKAIDGWIEQHRMGESDVRMLIELLAAELSLDVELAGEDATEEEKAAWYKEKEEECWLFMRRLLHHHHQHKSRIRHKIRDFNTLDDVATAIHRAKNIVVLTGAGISVSCGIPDFRSENGIYSLLGEYNLPSPQAMFDISYFRVNPVPFFSFAKQLLPGSYKPSPTHHFISLLAKQGKLLRNYTQNIDGLEKVAGVPAHLVKQCHGSFDTATCTHCRHKVPLSTIESRVRAQKLPMCDECGHFDGLLKPDIVFFGEPLGDEFARCLSEDRFECDLVLVMGSSLRVAPVNQIIGFMPPDVPLVLVNREVVGKPHKFDVELLGDCDDVVEHLCSLVREKDRMARSSKESSSSTSPSSTGEWALERGSSRTQNSDGDSMEGEDDDGESSVGEERVRFLSPSTYLFRNAKPEALDVDHTTLETLFDLDAKQTLRGEALRAPWITVASPRA